MKPLPEQILTHYQLNPSNDDVIKWKKIPHYWPFVLEIQRSPVNSPHKSLVTRSFDVFFAMRLELKVE